MPRTLSVLMTLLVLAACSEPAQPRQIAITLDDAPIAKPLSYADDWERALAVDSLTAALGRFAAPATVFAIGADLREPSAALLMARWTDAGVFVANHSVSHRSFNGLGYREGVVEIAQAQATISRLIDSGRTSRYFRFPFLEEGRSLEDRRIWHGVLDSLALRSAPVSITTDDWRFDNDYAKAEAAEDWDARFQVGQAYLEHVKASVRLWDALGTELYDRNVRHVLMLHANRINRDYLGQILEWLAAEGFEFIPLDVAYQDPLYSDEVSWVGASGVSILEQIKQTRLANGEFASR